MPEFAHCVIRPHHGVPTIFADGQPIHGMTATSVVFGDQQVVRDFVDGGVEIMMIWIDIANHCWKGPGEYHWAYAERKLRHFEEHSADTKWLIRLRLGMLSGWYAAAYPTEVHNPPGTPRHDRDPTIKPVLVSPVWREHTCELLAAFVAWLKTTRWAPRIIGFMLNAGATEEWLIFDTADTFLGRYHEAYTRELRLWLKRRYEGNLDALRLAWDDPKVDFENAQPPRGRVRNGSHIWGPYSLRDPRADRPAIDYYRFLNDTLADNLIAICRSAKEAAASPIICGAFHSYLWWETGVYSYIQEYGHANVQRLNSSEWIDFISDITSYDGRYPGGPSGYLGLPHCQNLSGKLHYTEVDLATYANMSDQQREAWAKVDAASVPVRTARPAMPDAEWCWNLNFCGRDPDEQIAVMQREHAHNLITGTAYWWFDIKGRSFQPPPLVQAMKRLSDIGKQAIHWDRRSASEVCFVCSEDTPMYQAAMNGPLLRFELEANHGLLLDLCNRQWGLCGFPYDIYELHDLGHKDFPGGQYKLMIFVNCGFIGAAAQAGIRRWQSDGRTMLWTYAAGVLDEQRLDPEVGTELRGMGLGWRNQRQQIRVMFEEHADELTRGGSALNFGTEGSVGPVFFADDPKAAVLARLRDGGEAAFAVREHADWRSVYLSMINFGPALMRNLARFAGAHVWCDSNDVVYANRSMLCLHSNSGGKKTIRLPYPARLTDLWTGQATPEPVREIQLEMPPYRTRIWRREFLQE